MKFFHRTSQWLLIWMVCGLVLGCAPRHIPVITQPNAVDTAWTMRTISNQELEAWAEKDPDLSRRACMEILARLNLKGRIYIQEDIKQRKALKVPNDFLAYLTWTPMPQRIAQVSEQSKFILVIKDIPFLGWYERGSLTGDTHICIGKKPGWTKAGLYRVKEKDVDHVSASYRNAYGSAALMPFAMRIYERVWIHGGDITGGYCSHGCINLPLDTAAELFKWTEQGTMVLIVESLEDLQQVLVKHSALLGKAPAGEGCNLKTQGSTGAVSQYEKYPVRKDVSAVCETAPIPPHRGL